jgi:hypothetical protein
MWACICGDFSKSARSVKLCMYIDSALRLPHSHTQFKLIATSATLQVILPQCHTRLETNSEIFQLPTNRRVIAHVDKVTRYKHLSSVPKGSPQVLLPTVGYFFSVIPIVTFYIHLLFRGLHYQADLHSWLTFNLWNMLHCEARLFLDSISTEYFCFCFIF